MNRIFSDTWLPVHGEWKWITREMYDYFEKAEPDVYAAISYRWELWNTNKMAMFLAHGVPWHSEEQVIADGKLVLPASKYPEEWLNDGWAFLNDWENDIVLMLGPNQQGKSYLLAMWIGLRVQECDPKWLVFNETPLICPEWKGPKKYTVASYSWDNVDTIWNRVRDIFPADELGDYAPGGGKNLSFGDGRPKKIELACGSELKFLCYTQQQMHWEGDDWDGGGFDEQPQKERWIGWNRGTTTRGDYTPSAHALTGHVLDDRPDTGASGWIKRELWGKTEALGRKVAWYHLSVDSTPEAVVSEKKKAGLRAQWVDPLPNGAERSEKDKRAAIARYWGGWEEGSGLVFSEWDRGVHVINPLWKDDNTPRTWTLSRSIDYGDNGVTCCSWWAINPQGWAVCYRVLYERGLLIADAARLIIEMSHNKQEQLRRGDDNLKGQNYAMFKEIQSGEQFYTSLLDSRSAGSSHQNEPTLIQVFSIYGLDLVVASGQHDYKQIPRLKDWLRIDYTVKHISRKNKDGTACMGAPNLYFFDGLTDPGIVEIETLEVHKTDPRKIAINQAHHFIDTAKYWASDNPMYIENWASDSDNYRGWGDRGETGY